MASVSEYRKARIRLYTEIAAVVVVVIASVGNITVTTDLATNPTARPDSFTGTDFDRFHEHEFEPVRAQLEECRQNVWRDREMLRDLERSVSDLQSQVLYLHQQLKQD